MLYNSAAMGYITAMVLVFVAAAIIPVFADAAFQKTPAIRGIFVLLLMIGVVLCMVRYVSEMLKNSHSWIPPIWITASVAFFTITLVQSIYLATAYPWVTYLLATVTFVAFIVLLSLVMYWVKKKLDEREQLTDRKR